MIRNLKQYRNKSFTNFIKIDPADNAVLSSCISNLTRATSDITVACTGKVSTQAIQFPFASNFLFPINNDEQISPANEPIHTASRADKSKCTKIRLT